MATEDAIHRYRETNFLSNLQWEPITIEQNRYRWQLKMLSVKKWICLHLILSIPIKYFESFVALQFFTLINISIINK